MKITIEAESKEISDLVLAVQDRLKDIAPEQSKEELKRQWGVDQ